MINIQCNFRTIAKSVRHYLSDYGLRVIEQNHRFFAKATSFPCVLLVERTFGDLGRFKVSVVGESKKRMSLGIFGMSAVLVEKNNLDPSGKTFNILHFEGDDYGRCYLFVYSWVCLEQFCQHHFGCQPDEIDLDKLIKRLIKETYWGSRGHAKMGTGEFSEPVKDFTIADEKVYRLSEVTREGAFFGFETQDEQISYFMTYQPTADISAYSEEELSKVYDIIDRQQQEYDDKPWLFSPLISNPPAFTPHKFN